MKRTIIVIFSLLLILLLLSACADKADTQKNGDSTVNTNISAANDSVTEQDQTEYSVTEVDNNDNTDVATNKKLSIVTTIFPQYDFAKQIVGDKANVTMLLKPGLDGHSYEPTPQDIKTIQAGDLFIYTGGENDAWVDSIIESMGDQAPETMKILDLVDTLDEEIIEGMQHDHDHKDHDQEEHDHEDQEGHNHEEDEHEHIHEIDEHVWTSPVNAIAIVEQITDALKAKDPVNAGIYSENCNAYIEKLEDLDQQFENVVDKGKRKVILFGDRFPFRYFADEYDLDYYAAFTGCSADTEASAATVAFLIDKVRELQLPVVFAIEFSNEKIADSIVEATEAEKLTFHSIHNLSVEELAAGETYISLMEKNLKVLEKALN
ncbi:MAG TPA: zinc ABC transporter substrate-binding protein [Clostridiaceae bacterium]|nr:zinc ABC transporter substrate-binding protein [Clostridiaceae bacterium]